MILITAIFIAFWQKDAKMLEDIRIIGDNNCLKIEQNWTQILDIEHVLETVGI